MILHEKKGEMIRHRKGDAGKKVNSKRIGHALEVGQPTSCGARLKE